MTTTVEAALANAVAALRGVTDTAALDAQVLLQCCVERGRAWLLSHPQATLTPAQRARFEALVGRRRDGEPVAYLTGRREFWSLPLEVTPGTLIPRAETELLVERALARIPQDARYCIADLGTGSGAVALALATERPRCRIVATDLSAQALAVARDNADRLGAANVEFLLGDWLRPLAGQRFELIVSNPPYVAVDDPCRGQGDVRFEPGLALDAGGDGLVALDRITTGARHHLVRDGWLLVEHGSMQGDAVATLFARDGYVDITGYRDLQSHPRVTEGRWCPPA